jgi:hypothetical protein
MMLAAADAAWRMLGKVTTATDVSSGRTASFSVAMRIEKCQHENTQSGVKDSPLTFRNYTKGAFGANKEAVEVVPSR